MKTSYDYSDFLEELREKIEEGTLSLEDNIKIVRYDRDDTKYRPILEWYYEDDKPNEEFEIKKVELVIYEMEEADRLI